MIFDQNFTADFGKDRIKMDKIYLDSELISFGADLFGNKFQNSVEIDSNYLNPKLALWKLVEKV